MATPRWQPGTADERQADAMAPALVPQAELVAASGALAPNDTPRQLLLPQIGLVRVHAGRAAEAAARSLHAKAYAVGRDLVLGGGVARHATAGTLAHELAHVRQQSAPGRSPAVQAQDAGGGAPLGPIGQARVDVADALRHAVERLDAAIAARDAGVVVPHDVDDALCRYFAGFGPQHLDDLVARLRPMADWVAGISVLRVPRPAPAGTRDAALLNLIAHPAQAMVRRDLPAMDPGDDYIAVFPDWDADPTLQATRLLHEVFHYAWPGMHHANSWDNAFAWQGLVSHLAHLNVGAALTAQFPPCP